MKVLLIGQLPKEIGGNYTTGAANVVFELGKQNVAEVEYFTYGTNIAYASAKKSSNYVNQYIGYKLKPFKILVHLLLHPIKFLKNWTHYCFVDHKNPIRLAFYEDNIREAINVIKPDLIHVNSINNVSPTKFALDDKNIPILLTCHGIFYRGDIRDKNNRDCYLGNIKLVDAYSGLTHEAQEEYEKILGISRDRVTIIPNGVDCSKFYFSAVDRKKKREELGITDTCKVFITVASVQERKGQLNFVKFLERLNLDFQYWIIGKGPHEKEIKEYIQKHDMYDRIRLLGYKDPSTLYQYYSAADVYAHPSIKEGQALCELEAKATGLPTMVNKDIIGTIANDITKDDYYVMDFDNLDYIHIENWLTKNRERQSQNNLDWKYIAQKYADLYKQIIRLNNN